MKIFQSSINSSILRHLYKLFPDKKVNVLRSFGVHSSDDILFLNGTLPNVSSLMEDSGTFTNNLAPTGAEEKISIDDYIPHLQKYESCYDYYSNFDNNFSPSGFKENRKALRKMEAVGLQPFPVIHDYFMREIRFYLAKGYDFLALGGVMLKGSKTKLRTQKHVEHAMSIIPADKVRVHLFGASSYNAIAHLPLYSCDSSSWALNNKYGFILYWNPNKSGENKTDKLFFVDKMKDYFRNDRQYWETYKFRNQLEAYIGSLGFTYGDLMGHEAHHYRQLLNVIYYLTIEEIITEKQELKKLLAA